MVPTEGFEIKKTVVFARCGCLPSDLCVLISEGYTLWRPGAVEGVQIKRGIKRMIGGFKLGLAGLR